MNRHAQADSAAKNTTPIAATTIDNQRDFIGSHSLRKYGQTRVFPFQSAPLNIMGGPKPMR